ncbi:MAG: hypothetical protein DRO18_01550 [Thermoprotei archaeon]|nr:MAG: hypothetical protein DRO18_01550 [Thermoprotei archaeon]
MIIRTIITINLPLPKSTILSSVIRKRIPTFKYFTFTLGSWGVVTVTIDELLPKLVKKVDILLEYNGVKVLDRRVAELLKLIDRYGSILLASKSLGVPYSRAWEWVTKIEYVLGIKVVERRRGGVKGGGTSLTDDGKKLLKYYEDLLKEYGLHELQLKKGFRGIPQLMIAGSHDIVLEVFIGYLRRKYGVDIEVSWIGSSGGLAALMLNETDIATAHLYDEVSGTYNIPFLRNYWLDGKVVVIRGYQRELVFAYHPSLSFSDVDEILEGLVKGEVRLVNRNVGSGTRVLLDTLIRRFCKDHGLNYRDVVSNIRGYGLQVRTHVDVAKAIIEGRGDVGLMLRCSAELYNLKYIHVKWENYDFIILRDRSSKEYVKRFIDELASNELMSLIRRYPGYKVNEELGKVIYS